MEASITLKSLAKRNDTSIVLADLSLGIENNSTHALIGKNGSGKSTILRIIAGIVEKDAGIVYLNGKDISIHVNDTKHMIGYMPQYIDLDDDLSVLDNLLVFSTLFKIPDKIAKKHILKFSDKFNFKNNLLDYPNTLSEGILRAVQFTRSLIHDPEILLLDEPTKGMDPKNSMLLWSYLDKISTFKTVLFATQNFDEAEKYADRISILHNGDIKMDGSLDKLIGAMQGLQKFEIRFSDNPDDNLIQHIKNIPSILKPELNGKTLGFYSNNRKDFFHVLKIALDLKVSDIDMSLCGLLDLYLGLVDNGID